MATKKTAAKKTIRERLKDASDVIGAVTVIGTACVCVGTWSVTQINADTNEKLDSISDQVTELKLDTTRNQLLTLMNNYPDNNDEIMKVAKYYFKDLGGDWYMTELFIEWGEENGVDVTSIVNMNGGK